ncbi:hypothetical protein IMZ48_17885 [Candidatus Bathyarchaeota archaeon]|nr:hypothetical protein [Candidatus Bathyarchaeota archaeon]
MIDFVATSPELRELWGLYYLEGTSCPEYQSWLTKWKGAWPKPPLLSLSEWTRRERVRAKKEALVKRIQTPVLTEQSINFLPLPVNPDTGELNPNSLPLESIWLLEALLDPIITNPGNLLKALNGEVCPPLHFMISTQEVREKIGRRFGNEEQLRAFKNLRRWELVRQYIWDTKKGKRGGWEPVKMEIGTVFAYQWKVTEMRRAGRPDRAGTKVNYVLEGTISPLAGFILRWNLAHHRIRPIPKLVYRMSEGAQLLYRQGLPFVLTPSGWRLTYKTACRILGYPEDPIDFQPKLIEKYLRELGDRVHWRRDKETERKDGGPGRDRLWVLKIGKRERHEWYKKRLHQARIDREKNNLHKGSVTPPIICTKAQ